MPQMAPMFWTLLMLMFTFAFILFAAKMYFYLENAPEYTKDKILFNMKKHWPW
uniref:ATP synthase complex subunit 8 n=1 Tax=Proasellus ortizi TaxID=1282012 RepID=A0A485M983_9CRUS|nr:ATP synthase 8 [Proasellus ortizi]